jgi:hypothetical protein
MCVMVGRPGQVAVDWMTGNLYYTQDGSPFITVCSRKKACLKIIRVSHPVNSLTCVPDPHWFNTGRI